MRKLTLELACLTRVMALLDDSFTQSLLATCWRIVACVRTFVSREITPRSFERFERRIEKTVRELGRLVIQQTVSQVETQERPAAIEWEYRKHSPQRRVPGILETRLGTIHYERWYFDHDLPFGQGLAPLDCRLGIIGQRVSPGIAHKLGRLAADLPQQRVIDQLREEFNVSLSVQAYRRVVEELSTEINFLHDDLAIEQLAQWIHQSKESTGKHDVLLLVGRDGVHVPMRGCWKEAACATLTVYDRNRKRLGTIYLGQMPQKNQTRMTERLTKVIRETLQQCSDAVPRLRYVTDAGGLPKSYFKKVLCKMTHPESGKLLVWSWGVDFFHACEYVSLLADTLWGVGTAKAQEWFKQQRHILKHHIKGVSKVLSSAAQSRRRHGLVGSAADYKKARGYLDRHRQHMDYATRRNAGDPIGSGVTEAGCKVIFNQRMKQSGMRWSKLGGQRIVDLRTACRSGLWDRIWLYRLDIYRQLPHLDQRLTFQTRLKAA